jgi:hypothetical protein
MYFVGNSIANLRGILRSRQRAYQVFECLSKAERHGVSCEEIASEVFGADPASASSRLVASARHNVIKTISRLNEFFRECGHADLSIVFDRRKCRYVMRPAF